jgi:hypothetical protein
MMFPDLMSAMNRNLSYPAGHAGSPVARRAARDRGKKKPALLHGPKRSVENVPESRLNLG